MEAVMVVVYDRRGQVRFRQKLLQLPATLGRSATSDVILDDRLVSGIHARLEEDAHGRLVLRDLESKNGIRVGRSRVTEITFPAARAVLLGNTRVAVSRLSEPIERTEVRRVSFWDRSWIVLPGLASVVVAEGIIGWLAADELRVLKLVAEEVLPVVLGLALWALGWAIASRIALGVFRFTAHLSLAALAVGAWRWTTALVLPAVGFVASFHPETLRYLVDGCSLVFGGWLLAQHLCRVGTWSLRRCYLIGAVAMAAIGLPTELTQLARSGDFQAQVALPREALPPAWVVHAMSVSDFISRTEPLQVAADHQRVSDRPVPGSAR